MQAMVLSFAAMHVQPRLEGNFLKWLLLLALKLPLLLPSRQAGGQSHRCRKPRGVYAAGGFMSGCMACQKKRGGKITRRKIQRQGKVSFASQDSGAKKVSFFKTFKEECNYRWRNE